MKNIRSHVGVPHFLLKRFANEEKQVAVFDLGRKTKFYVSPNKIGVEKNYYDEQTEQLLSRKEELPFNNLLLKLDKADAYYKKTSLLNENRKTVLEFIKFQHMRSKRTLESVNMQSLFANSFGSFTHSKLLEITTKLRSNPIEMIPAPQAMLMLETNGARLVNSSLGTYFVPRLKPSSANAFELKCILVPISCSEAICVVHSFPEQYSHLCCDPDDTNKLNDWCYISEKILGNGFLFAEDISDLPKVS